MKILFLVAAGLQATAAFLAFPYNQLVGTMSALGATASLGGWFLAWKRDAAQLQQPDAEDSADGK